MNSARVALLLLSAVATTFVGWGQADAQPSGSFACRASPVDILGLEPVVANGPGAPCVTASSTNPGLNVGLATIKALSASTRLLPDGTGATAQANLAGLDVPMLGLHAGVIESDARVSCLEGQPRLSGSSHVAGLTVNGSPVASDRQLDIPLAVGTLHLNSTATAQNGIVVTPVRLDTMTGSIVLGASRVGFSGNPCAPPPPPAPGTITVIERSEPLSPLSFLFHGDLGAFSLRDDPAAPTGDRLTATVPPGSYRVSELPVGVGDWRLRAIECVDPDGDAVVALAQMTVVVNLDSGENVTCTFTNRSDAGVTAASLGGLALTGPSSVVPISNPTRGPAKLSQSSDSGTAAVLGPPVTSPPPFPPPPLPVSKGATFPTAGVGIAVLLLVLGGLIMMWLLAGRRRRKRGAAQQPGAP